MKLNEIQNNQMFDILNFLNRENFETSLSNGNRIGAHFVKTGPISRKISSGRPKAIKKIYDLQIKFHCFGR